MGTVSFKEEKIKTYISSTATYVCKADFWRALTDEYWKIMKIVEADWEVLVTIAWNWEYNNSAENLETVEAYTYN